MTRPAATQATKTVAEMLTKNFLKILFGFVMKAFQFLSHLVSNHFPPEKFHSSAALNTIPDIPAGCLHR